MTKGEKKQIDKLSPCVASRHFFSPLWLSVVVWGLLLFEQAHGSNFKVSPVQVFLSVAEKSAALSLRNAAPVPLRFQIKVFAWEESPEGHMVLNPTQDIIFFPRLLTLEPNEDRKVRIGSLVPFSPVEKTYRIFIEELPPLETKETPRTQVRILTRIGIPIFLVPLSTKTNVQLADFKLERGLFSFSVMNDGNVHTSLEKIEVHGVDAHGNPVWTGKLQGWYVLANGRRHYELAVPKASCAKIAAFTTEVQALGTPLTVTWSAPGGGCVK